MSVRKSLKKTKKNVSKAKPKKRSSELRNSDSGGAQMGKARVPRRTAGDVQPLANNGYCPECLNQAEGSIVHISPTDDLHSSWQHVLKAYRCTQCEFLVPAHIWELWNELTAEGAVEEWSGSFRPNPTSVVDQSLMNQIVNSVLSEGQLPTKTDVEYVDEDGNPFDVSSRDLDSLAFCDEYGRATDHLGNLIDAFLSEPDAASAGEKLLRGGKSIEAVEHSIQYLEYYPANLVLWRVLGCGQGGIGNAKAARIAFLSALKLDPTDGLTLSNYITACFDTGDKKSGIEGIEQFFDELAPEAQRVVLDSLIEALKTGLVQSRDLPASIKKLVK